MHGGSLNISLTVPLIKKEITLTVLINEFLQCFVHLEFSDEVEVTTRFIDKLRKMEKLESLGNFHVKLK